LSEDFPNRPAYQKKLAETFNSLGTVAASTEDYVKAEEYYREARDTFALLVHDHGEVAEYQQLLGIAFGNLGWLRSKQKDWASARKHYEQSIPRLEKALEKNRKNPLSLKALCGNLQSLAETQIRLGDHAGAVKSAVAMTNVYGGRGQDYYFAACFFARAMRLADKDAQLVKRYKDDAFTMLSRARDAGSVTRLPDEEEIFGALLSEPRFEKVLLELGAKAKT
jgi:tetratricopeptide (TPR) repeat protein